MEHPKPARLLAVGPDDCSTTSYIYPDDPSGQRATNTAQTRLRTGGRPPGPPTATRPTQARPAGRSSCTQQRRRWIGLLLVLAVLLIAAGIISALILDRRISSAPAAQSSGEQQSSAAEPSPAQPSKLIIANARDFDPQGDDQTENPDEVKFAYDGDASTRWRTVQYFGNPKLGNLKRGVGLVLDLETSATSAFAAPHPERYRDHRPVPRAEV